MKARLSAASLRPIRDDFGASDFGSKVASNLRRQRQLRGMSLEDLAKASGVSRAALSQVETLKSNPTLAFLWKTSIGLGVALSELLDAPRPVAGLLRRRQAPVIRSINGSFACTSLAPPSISRFLEFDELRLAAGGVYAADAHSAGSHELVAVYSGTLRVRVGGQAYELEAGDSVGYRADQPRTYENAGMSLVRCNILIA